MRGWKLARLGDCIEVKHGYAFPGDKITNNPGPNILLTPGNFKIGGGFKGTKYKYFIGDIPDGYILHEGDLIITMTDLSKDTDTLGYSALIPFNIHHVFLHNQRIGLVNIINNKIDKLFLYWLLRTYDYREHIIGSATGTSVQHTSPNRIREYSFLCPPFGEQRAIATVLSSLDDKIDLLQRQNATLEAMAEALFKQWFVENAKEEWKTGCIPDEFEFTMGQSPSGDSFNEVGLGVPMFQGNADFGFRFPSKRIYTTAPTRFAQPFDTLISVRAPVGAQNMAQEKCCIGRGLSAFRYKKNPSFYSYTYFKLRHLLRDILIYNDEGTVFGSISKKDFDNLTIAVPDKNAVAGYEKKSAPLNDKIISNCEQIRTLEKLRDTLLPKLMSGEVRVSLD